MTKVPRVEVAAMLGDLRQLLKNPDRTEAYKTELAMRFYPFQFKAVVAALTSEEVIEVTKLLEAAQIEHGNLTQYLPITGVEYV